MKYFMNNHLDFHRVMPPVRLDRAAIMRYETLLCSCINDCMLDQRESTAFLLLLRRLG